MHSNNPRYVIEDRNFHSLTSAREAAYRHSGRTLRPIIVVYDEHNEVWWLNAGRVADLPPYNRAEEVIY